MILYDPFYGCFVIIDPVSRRIFMLLPTFLAVEL